VDWLQALIFSFAHKLALYGKACIIGQAFPFFMPYVISTIKDNINYCISADLKSKSFKLIAVESDSDLTKVFCHPYRDGAVQILNWINDNDPKLEREQLKVCDESQFRR
jgi:hypothetical protein